MDISSHDIRHEGDIVYSVLENLQATTDSLEREIEELKRQVSEQNREILNLHRALSKFGELMVLSHNKELEFLKGQHKGSHYIIDSARKDQIKL